MAQVIVKETHNPSSDIRYYLVGTVKSPKLMIKENKKYNVFNVVNIFKTIFLPQGYPYSVSEDYISYQIWDTAQAFCSTITGVMAIQEVFRGVGVGDTESTPMAATVTWVIKEGCGHFGKILFSYSHGSFLDAYSKKWRLFADTLNNAAMCMEIALPLCKNYTTAILCISSVMKAIVGVAGGATRAAMTQHHVMRNNFADVAAKDYSQETAVNLVASLIGLLILTIFGNSLSVFFSLMVLHIIFNYLAVRSVCLKAFNEPRFLETIKHYLMYGLINTPSEINKIEPILHLGLNYLDLETCGFQIKMGHSIKDTVMDNLDVLQLSNWQYIYFGKYLLIPNLNDRTIYVYLKDTINEEDILKAYFHSVLLSISICLINKIKLPIYVEKTNTLCYYYITNICKGKQYRAKHICTKKHSFTYTATFALHKYVNELASKEWLTIRSSLLTAGWDLSKHLLIVDEWRISSEDKIINKLK